jgi:hypothetical protein
LKQLQLAVAAERQVHLAGRDVVFWRRRLRFESPGASSGSGGRSSHLRESGLTALSPIGTSLATGTAVRSKLADAGFV